MAKQRNHNEWIMGPLAKRTCPCGEKKTEVYGWGEYVIGKWRTVDHFCRKCFQTRVLAPLRDHADDCGCSITFQPRSGYRLPDFIRVVENIPCRLEKAS